MNRVADKIEKYPLFLPLYANIDYDAASDLIIEAAIKQESIGVSALAVHGLMTSLTSERLKACINKIHLIVPDGQPIRWALNSFHGLKMKDRVYGPTLTLHVLKKAHMHGLNLFLFGSKAETIKKLSDFIALEYPNVKIVGLHPDRFRDATPEEDEQDIQRIKRSGANIVLVGRGCPRQEIWVADHIGKIDAPMLAVGAAFDFHARTIAQAPLWMQDHGLEWIFRLIREPKRLWKRYLVTNSQFIFTFLYQKYILKTPTKRFR